MIKDTTVEIRDIGCHASSLSEPRSRRAHAPDCPSLSRARANRVLSLSNGGKPPLPTMSTQGHQVTPPYHAGRVGGYNGLTMSQVPGPKISAHLARSIWPCAICIYISNLTPSVSLCGPLHYSALLFYPSLPASHSRVSSSCSPFVGTRARTCNPGSRARPRAWTESGRGASFGSFVSWHYLDGLDNECVNCPALLLSGRPSGCF